MRVCIGVFATRYMKFASPALLYVCPVTASKIFAAVIWRAVYCAARNARRANRKPTKDERIAELERKVAELENKDMQ